MLIAALSLAAPAIDTVPSSVAAQEGSSLRGSDTSIVVPVDHTVPSEGRNRDGSFSAPLQQTFAPASQSAGRFRASAGVRVTRAEHVPVFFAGERRDEALVVQLSAQDGPVDAPAAANRYIVEFQ